MDFIVLKKTGEGDQASDWTPLLLALEVEDEDTAICQAFDGSGKYRALPWRDEDEADVDPGAPQVTRPRREAPEAEPAEQAEPA